MARALRASVALSALALSAFAGVAVAAPKADNPNAGPPPDASDPCLDIVNGGGHYVLDPVATVPAPTGDIVIATSGTLTFEMDVAAPSCVKGSYTLVVFSDPTTDPATGTTLVPSRQVATATQKGTGQAVTDPATGTTVYPVYFTVQVDDPTSSLRDTSNPCVSLQGITTSKGQTADVAPDPGAGTYTVCTEPPATAPFH